MHYYELLWAAAIVLFTILEAATAGLVSIWFAAGALCGLIAAILGASIIWQIVLFLAVSVVCFLLLRRHAVKSILKNPEKTDTDRLIGTQIVLTQAINEKNQCGKAIINDVEWRVKSSNGEPIAAGESVTIEKIEGVSLIVKK